MKATIEVTLEDIKKGQSAFWPPSTSCAIVCALNRHFKVEDAEWGYVQGTAGRLSLRSLSPISTKRFVEQHDAKKQVRPFKFRVEIQPEESR